MTAAIIGAAIEVHKACGPGLLEGVYTECLTYELRDRGLEVERGVKIPITYRGRTLSTRYYLDLRVNRAVIVEVKSVAALAPVHTAQVLTYLKLADCPVGLLINFNVPLLRDGIDRVVRPLLRVETTEISDPSDPHLWYLRYLPWRNVKNPRRCSMMTAAIPL